MTEQHATLLALEQRLLDPSVRQDRDELERLLLTEFVEFGSSGRSFSRDTILAELAKSDAVQLQGLGIEDFFGTDLASGVVLVTYRLVGQDAAPVSLRSSIWLQVEGRWRMRFHQGTRVNRAG